MSRRIKADRRNPIERNPVIEIVSFIDYPGIPQDFVEQLKWFQKELVWIGRNIQDEIYRHDGAREGMAYTCFNVAENIAWLLEEHKLIPGDE
jgi:hypothetical protein